MKIPRILLAAGSSGSGKTLITCGLLEALVERGLKTASFKCGPDYIDPMFHSRVIGTKSRNLDTFFTGSEVTKYLLTRNARDCEIAVMEGVMGFYDGVAGTTTTASAYDLAKVTDTPVILIVNSRGMSVSLAAYVKGFLEYKKDSHIKGVIFNQMSPMLYPRMKKLLEEELGVAVLGYVPKVEDCVIESRHLGLVLPDEIPELKDRLHKLAGVLEETLDIDRILELAGEAPDLLDAKPESVTDFRLSEPVRIGVAEDEAFCFFYADNFRLLGEMGAEIVPFSPMEDKQLPDDLDGLLLYGGYPELNGKKLEQNTTMKDMIREKLKAGMPCMAECGGFMYLHEQMEDMGGVFRKTCGVIPGKCFRTPRLTRFGYITLTAGKPVFGRSAEEIGEIPAHEFHYFDSENCGSDFHAAKPMSKRGWDCMHSSSNLLAGYPHIYYYGNPQIPRAFLMKCLEYHNKEF